MEPTWRCLWDSAIIGFLARLTQTYLQTPSRSGDVPGLQRIDCLTARSDTLEAFALPVDSPLLARLVADISTGRLATLGLATSIA